MNVQLINTKYERKRQNELQIKQTKYNKKIINDVTKEKNTQR